MLPCQVEHNGKQLVFTMIYKLKVEEWNLCIFLCGFFAEQDDSIAWMHFNNNLFTDAHKLTERNAYELDPITHTLSIKNYTADLAGNYTCAIPLKKIYITHIVGQKGTFAF